MNLFRLGCDDRRGLIIPDEPVRTMFSRNLPVDFPEMFPVSGEVLFSSRIRTKTLFDGCAVYGNEGLLCVNAKGYRVLAKVPLAGQFFEIRLRDPNESFFVFSPRVEFDPFDDKSVFNSTAAGLDLQPGAQFRIPQDIDHFRLPACYLGRGWLMCTDRIVDVFIGNKLKGFHFWNVSTGAFIKL